MVIIIFIATLLFFTTLIVDRRPAANIGAASLAGRCINGHFIAINIIWPVQASLGFCLLTFTFISLISSGFRLEVIKYPTIGNTCTLCVMANENSSSYKLNTYNVTNGNNIF